MNGRARDRGSSSATRRFGFTLVETLMALVVSLVVVAVLYGAVRTLFSRRSRASLATATERAFAGKDVRIGLKQLMLRIREGTQILSPEPGASASELVFRDVLNQKVRIVRDAKVQELVSERLVGGRFRREGSAAVVRTGTGEECPVGQPIRIRRCSNASFTTLSPSCVVVTLTVASGHVENAMMTAVHLRNHELAQ